jgi:glycosyltransferase involved in cell wall biosynthesis
LSSSTQILLSVIMTSYNREKYVAEAIQSVLSSTFTDFEFIICDDCSSDNTYRIEQDFAARDPRIRLYRNESQLGDFPNRDLAASYARGTYVKYVDSDDIISPDALKIMVQAMQQYPGALLGLSQIANELNDVRKCPELITPEQAYLEHYFGYGTLRYGPTGAILKKEVLKEMGGFGQNRYVGDTELWLRIVSKYPMVKIRPGLVVWRRHTGQEFYRGTRFGSYVRKAYPVYMKSLMAPDCPLEKKDVKHIIKRLQWKHARDILSIAFRKWRLKTAFVIYRESDLNLRQLLKGLIPYRFVRKQFVDRNDNSIYVGTSH